MANDEQKPPQGRPGELVIGASTERILVRIAADGTLTYGEGYTPDEAAKMFWEAIARKRADYEERLVFITHVEELLTKIGRQDLKCEAARLKANETKNAHDEFQAERAIGQLQVLVHEVIELARGVALRDKNNAEPPTEGGAPPNVLLN